MGEIWQDIKDFEGTYQVSNLGRVKRLNVWVGNQYVNKTINKERFLKPWKSYKDYEYYYCVELRKKPLKRTAYVHRLVAEHFLDNPNNLPQINHIDGNKENNNVNNLEFCTANENMKHSYKIGLRNKERLREHMRKVGKSKKGLEVRWRK